MNALALALIFALTNRFGSVSVDTYGARVLSYVPAGEGEVLAQLPSGQGGIPLCWPWFQYGGPNGKDSPKHGLARYHDFKVVNHENDAEESRLVLVLLSNAETYRAWPYDFALTVTVVLDAKGLTVDMTGQNTGDRPFPVTEAIHPYFRREKLAEIRDEGTGDFRTWDPDASSHLKTQGLESDDWKDFICVENGTFWPDKAYWLQPGDSHTLCRMLAPLRKKST